MSGQATGKRQHVPIRFRLYASDGTNDLLIHDARVGTSKFESASDLGRRWFRGTELEAHASSDGRTAHALMVGLGHGKRGLFAEILDGLAPGVAAPLETLHILRIHPVQSPQPPHFASGARSRAWPLYHQVIFTNDTIN